MKDEYKFYNFINILLIIIIIFTMPEFVKVLGGQCVFGLELLSYRIFVFSCLILSILILKRVNHNYLKGGENGKR